MAWFLSNRLCENLRSLQEQAGASLEENSLAGAPSAPSKSNLTVVKFSCGGRTKGTSNLSPSGMTCEHLTDARGMDSWMSLVADSRAKTSALPEKVRESKASGADSGKSLCASLAKYDPVSRSWKIARHLFGEDLAQSSETWPRWGMTVDGELYPLLIAALPIYEKECGLWPTPEASLNIAPYAPKTARNWGGQRPSGAVIGSSLRWFPEFLDDSDSGAEWVNPVLCEVMMGWPKHWTDSTPLETAKFQSWQQQHGESCQEPS